MSGTIGGPNARPSAGAISPSTSTVCTRVSSRAIAVGASASTPPDPQESPARARTPTRPARARPRRPRKRRTRSTNGDTVTLVEPALDHAVEGEAGGKHDIGEAAAGARDLALPVGPGNRAARHD